MTRRRRTWRKAGCYLWRTRKPHAPIGLPLLGRHNGYVGQTNSRRRRDEQHQRGSLTYGTMPARWSDLEPKVYALPCLFPNWKRARLAQEWLWIKLLMPVYNVQHNRTNPRRITPRRAAAQRAERDRVHLGFNLGRLAVRWVIGAVVWTAIALVGWEKWINV